MKAVVSTGLTPVGPLLQAFFIDYLYGQKRASAQTVESYRDTFRLLLRFLQQTTGKAPSALHTLDLDAPVILRFLDHLECQRNNQPQSRNVRLAAVRSFFRMAAIRDPGSVGVATRVLAIPVKRTDKRLLGYLTRQEMDALLGAHELSQWAGRRDHALLLTLYNTGARVSEMTGLQKTQVHFGTKTFVQFKGKGRKERAVPLEADLALKEKALSKVAPAGQKTKRFRADDELLRFLSSL
jgi:integrase/recombinase XerD